MTRRYNPRLAKRHRTYQAFEIIELFDVSMSTVRRWHALGLDPIEQSKPYLYSGEALQTFIRAHNPPRTPLMPGEIYCVACKKPVPPHGNAVELVDRSRTSGDLVGHCPNCRRLIFRRVRLAELAFRAGLLTVRHEEDKAPVSSDGERVEVTLSRTVTS